MTAAKWHRKLHRIGAIVAALPLLVIVASGLLLQLKKDWSWVQPVTLKGSATTPSVDFDAILAAVAAVPEAGVTSWEDVDRIDVRPSHGMLKVQCASSYEVQLDAATGEVLGVEYRRSDLIEAIHDGTWFHERAKLWIFLPAGLILLGLWITGVYLWFLPHLVKRRRRSHLPRA